MTDLDRQYEVGWERHGDLEQEHHRMQEDHEEHQQQMTEIPEKVSDQVQKVENMGSECMPIIARKYPSPPIRQTSITIHVEYYPKPTNVFRARTSAKYRRVDSQ